MQSVIRFEFNPRTFKVIDILIIVLISIIPLFTSFNYRSNIFLTWEGAYRMYLGQMPYRDFGLPLGFGLWLVPALFFKLFGPQLVTLVKAQVFLNLIAGFSFTGILKNFNVQAGVITLSILVFTFSYYFLNFWPWYNHTVIVYQLAGIALLTSAYRATEPLKTALLLCAAAGMLMLSFFTKQDAGALGIIIGLVLTISHAVMEKRWQPAVLFCTALVLWALTFVLPLNESFGYWFNYGQPPHNSRFSIYDILEEFMAASQWIKFYLLGIFIVIWHRINQKQKIGVYEILFALLTLGILAEAAIFQVTSYVPFDNNIFFHSFAFAFFGWYLAAQNAFRPNQVAFFVIASALVLLIWSSSYWKYADRLLSRFKPSHPAKTTDGENIVDKTNYVKNTYYDGSVPTSQWKESGWYAFEKVRMPQSTVDGMNRLKAMPEFANPAETTVLNMTELTPLAHDLGFNLETDSGYPLWFHLGVGMFNKQLQFFDKRVQEQYYDVVLYEYAEHLNNFYPFELREQLQKHYKLGDKFLAPRDPTNTYIEVYTRP